jgi:hypothetical protein
MDKKAKLRKLNTNTPEQASDTPLTEIEITLGGVYEIHSALVDFEQSGKLPLKTAWQVDDMKTYLAPHATKYQTRLAEILNSCGSIKEEVAGKQLWNITDTVKYTEGVKELNAVMITLSLKSLPPLDAKTLFDTDIKVSAGTLKVLRNYDLIRN